MHADKSFLHTKIVVVTAFPAKMQGASADELHVKAAKILPLLDSPNPSKTQSTVGMVLGIHPPPASGEMNTSLLAKPWSNPVVFRISSKSLERTQFKAQKEESQTQIPPREPASP